MDKMRNPVANGAKTMSFTSQMTRKQAPDIDLTKRSRLGESFIQAFLFFCGAISIFTTIGIVLFLGQEAIHFFQSPEVSLWEFLTGTVWQPQIGYFGILPLLSATILTTAIARVVAIPLGLCVAMYLSEYASPQTRSTLKPIMEVIAGIPTVVLGFFALYTMTPLLRSILGKETVSIYNTASAGLVMGILILPLISSMVEDALSSVPRSLREAGYAMGATKFEVATQIVLPAAISGVSAALILGISRAMGEAMIVAIAAGAGPALTANPFRAAETITGHIVRISGGDLSYDSIDYNSLFALAIVLFVITLILNLISQRIILHFREVYE
jgi:phosphate transport system permease protein